MVAELAALEAKRSYYPAIQIDDQHRSPEPNRIACGVGGGRNSEILEHPVDHAVAVVVGRVHDQVTVDIRGARHERDARGAGERVAGPSHDECLGGRRGQERTSHDISL